MREDQIFSFNFWPAFADLMLSLILILLLVIGGAYFSSIDIRSIQKKQKSLAETLITPERRSRSVEGGVEILNGGGELLYRLTEDPNDPMLQVVTFSDSLLFESGKSDLTDKGKLALRDLGQVLTTHLADIVEIQIRGHADTDAIGTGTGYPDNLALASARANEVFRFLKDDVRISPADHLMSASSFGEFSPVQRRRDTQFGATSLEQANATDALKKANRRIELLLFYRRPGARKNQPAR
jgi:outer membrane protein OmpA-like peptidoglycan-associated protein